jgi:hypothetical protein
MYQRKPRRFSSRSRPNGRNHLSRGPGHGQRTNSFSNGPKRNNFRNIQNPEHLLEKYNTLAKEALSSGDKTLSENYLQHADHFIRMIEEKNKNREINKINIVEKATEETNPVSEKDVTKNQEINNN